MVAKDTWYILGAVTLFGVIIVMKQGSSNGWLGSGAAGGSGFGPSSGWVGSKRK